MASVRFEKINKFFGKTHVVDDLDLDIEDGEFIVLLGGSGCGKSTTLRMLAGLEEISSGNLYIGEELVNDKEPSERDIAMVFQSYALYPHMTVYQNIAFGLKISKMPKDEIDRKVKWASEMLGLDELLDRKPAALSGGQRQRVAMGRAMVRSPEVFLFDEPLSNLDAKLRHQMRAEIKALHNSMQKTILYVTHDQVEAMSLADRIVILNGGNVEQVGSPKEIYSRPANTFVASFIGSPEMNLIDAGFHKHEDHWSIEVGTANSSKSELSLPEFVSDRPLKLGIRPSNIHLRRESIAHDEVIEFEATLDTHELLGATQHLTCKVGGVPLVAEVSAQRNIPEDRKLKIYLDCRNLHLFDQASGERVEH